MKKYLYVLVGALLSSCSLLSSGVMTSGDSSTFAMVGPSVVFTNSDTVKKALAIVVYAEGPGLVLVGCETVKVSSEVVKGYTCKLGDLNPLGKITVMPTSGSINYSSETHYRIDSGKIPVIKTINLR